MMHNRGMFAHETPLVDPGNQKEQTLTVDANIFFICRGFVTSQLGVVTKDMNMCIANNDSGRGRNPGPPP